MRADFRFVGVPGVTTADAPLGLEDDRGEVVLLASGTVNWSADVVQELNIVRSADSQG
jgi:hypothetical protein